MLNVNKCACVCEWVAEHPVRTSALPATNSLLCYHGHHQQRNINERQKWERGREKARQQGREGGGDEMGDGVAPACIKGISPPAFARHVICPVSTS